MLDDDNLDRRITAARTDLRAALDPPAADLGRAAQHGAARRRAFAGAVAAFVVGATTLGVVLRDRSDTSNAIVAGPDGNGGNESGNEAASPPGTTTVPPPPTSDATLQSPTVFVKGVPTVLAAYVIGTASGSAGRIDILEWQDRWHTVASFEVPPPGVPEAADAAGPLRVHDVTGDGHLDFVVPLAAVSTAPYEVVSSDNGSWRQVPFGTPERVIVTMPDEPTEDRFVTSTNLCEPSCADGRYRRELWRYSRPDGRFIVVESAVCQAISPGQWRCEHLGSTVATGDPIGS